jgi:hypothetical protein
MKNDHEMDRLRAARPAAPPPTHDHEARFAQTIAEPGDPRLASSTTTGKARSARRWASRPRILAGGSLGLAGVAAGLVLAFSGSTAAPAFAVTQNADGSLLVHLNYLALSQGAAQQQINAADIPGQISFGTSRGPAPVPGPITCSNDVPGAQQVEMLLGSDGTYVVPAGQQGAGSWHLVECIVVPAEGATTVPVSTTGGPTVTTGETATNGAG